MNTGYVAKYKGNARIFKTDINADGMNYECVMEDGPHKGQVVSIEATEIKRKTNGTDNIRTYNARP